MNKAQVSAWPPKEEIKLGCSRNCVVKNSGDRLIPLCTGIFINNDGLQ